MPQLLYSKHKSAVAQVWLIFLRFQHSAVRKPAAFSPRKGLDVAMHYFSCPPTKK